MKNAEKTHCPHGHPYDETNTILTKTKYGTGVGRRCATCDRERWHRNKDRYSRNQKALPQSERVQRYNARHPEKVKARAYLNWMVRRGDVVKPDACEWCFKTGVKIDGAHDDYSKPLEVEWLCRQCHNKKDRRHGPMTKEQVRAELGLEVLSDSGDQS